MAFCRMLQRLLDRVIKCTADLIIVNSNFLTRRPVAWLVSRKSATHGINSKRKKLIERAMKALQAKRALAQQIPVESLDVAQVKNHPVAFRDRPFIKCFVAKDLEKFVAGTARAHQPGVMIVAGADG